MLFFDLIKVALGSRTQLPRIPSEEEWQSLFQLAQEQAIAGLLFPALDNLATDGQKPPLNVLYEWIGLSEQIKQRNILLNQRCTELMGLFENNGFRSCILKGQGNALMYPEPLYRTSGDIDIWVCGKREEIFEFCKSKAVIREVNVLHIQFPIYDDVDVEVHFVPSYSRVPRFTKRNRTFFEQFQREEICDRGLFPEGVKMYVPTKEMNQVFQMSHMARHFFYGGIGLRQVIDYYYLLKYTKEKVCPEEIVKIFKNLGLYKFACAVMWVIKEALGLDESYLLVGADKERGALLLDEIMKTGNFGQYDKRQTSNVLRKSATLSAITRNMRLLRLFPEEAFWTPFTEVWYFLKYRE